MHREQHTVMHLILKVEVLLLDSVPETQVYQTPVSIVGPWPITTLQEGSSLSNVSPCLYIFILLLKRYPVIVLTGYHWLIVDRKKTNKFLEVIGYCNLLVLSKT